MKFTKQEEIRKTLSEFSPNDTAKKMDYLKSQYAGKIAIIVTCGYSANFYKDKYAQFLDDDRYVIIAIKKASDFFDHKNDILFMDVRVNCYNMKMANNCNYVKFYFPEDLTELSQTVKNKFNPDFTIIKDDKSKCKFPRIDDNNFNFVVSIDDAGNIVQAHVDDHIPKAIAYCNHVGIKEIYVIGWDLLNPVNLKQTNHLYETQSVKRNIEPAGFINAYTTKYHHNYCRDNGISLYVIGDYGGVDRTLPRIKFEDITSAVKSPIVFDLDIETFLTSHINFEWYANTYAEELPPRKNFREDILHHYFYTGYYFNYPCSADDDRKCLTLTDLDVEFVKCTYFSHYPNIQNFTAFRLKALYLIHIIDKDFGHIINEGILDTELQKHQIASKWYVDQAKYCNMERKEDRIKYKWLCYRIRNIPKDFSSSNYREKYGDLKDFSDEQLMLHYIEHGVNEGRTYKYDVPDDFDVEQYRLLNKDLVKLSEPQLLRHYITHGKREARRYKFE
jgi:hypothetical protein